LAASIERGEIVPVPFNPWWFGNADAITLAFFQELGLAVGHTLPDKIRKSLSRIGGGVSAVGALAGAAANLKLPGSGKIISGAANLFEKVVRNRRTVEQEHAVVAKALADQKRRFLVVIDDIDRLNPDDALTIFRLVKSLGRLPNVVYLLSFDRLTAERMVAERFPSEGPSYLEKIVQSAFDIPPPLADLLRNRVLMAAERVMGSPSEKHITRFMNVFYDAVAPFIRTPRDVVRLDNDLQATWPAIAGEVDRADYLALSTFKLAKPELYRAIRDHPDDLCDKARDGVGRDVQLAEKYDKMLGLDPDSTDYAQLRKAMMRLFPRLESVWGNTFYNSPQPRLIASRKYFPTYFAYSISDDVLPAAQIDALIDRAEDPQFVRSFFQDRLAHRRRDGSTQAGLALEELTSRSTDVPKTKVAALTSAIFGLADNLDVEADELRGFSIGNNELRIHWLINKLVTDRFSIEDRDTIYGTAMAFAPVHWACTFARRCIRPFEPDDGTNGDQPIVSEGVAQGFKELTINRLRKASEDGSLIANRSMISLLFQWKIWTSITEVRAWTDNALANDAFVIAVANGVTSVGWTQSVSDRVARPIVRVNPFPLREILDLERFEVRAIEVATREDLSGAERQIMDRFLTAPRGDGMGPDRADGDEA